MSTRVGLTREELDDRDELATLKRILAQFDRRAIHDQMHEETIFFMTESLTQLRVNTQMIGVASLRNPAVRVLLKQMQEEIRDVETLAVIIAGKRPGQDWADSILDLRIFGGAQRDSAFRSQRFALQSRLDEAERFIHERIRHHFKEATDIDHRTLRERSYPPVENPSIPERKSLNSKQLANDVFCLYLFGAIDQLKSRILAKLEILQHELVK